MLEQQRHNEKRSFLDNDSIKMGIRDLFFKKPKRYLDEERFLESQNGQLERLPLLMGKLHEFGVTAEKQLKLEFFFYTNSAEKAADLAAALSKLNYEVEYGKVPRSWKKWLVTGWSTRITMSDEIVLDWTRKMCYLGFEYDCDFDGWGTFPDQSASDQIESDQSEKIALA